jgi:hypothetical protein
MPSTVEVIAVSVLLDKLRPFPGHCGEDESINRRDKPGLWAEAP